MDRIKLVGIANKLFEQHGLTDFGWRLEFRNYGHRIGCCYSGHRIIALDAFYADNNSEANVLDTLLHEIAHALVGAHHRHGPMWKAMALRLGCIPKACSKTDILVRPGKYQAICPTCARPFHKYRKPTHFTGYHCPYCGEQNGQLTFIAHVSGE